MKRVLFIAYLYPPLANSGTQRSLKFANYLPDYGWEPLVLTVDNSTDPHVDPKLLEEIRPGTHITRVPMLSDVIGEMASRPLSSFAHGSKLAAALSWRIRGQFQSPDLYALWRPMAVRAGCRLFREIGFDAIWATGFPWTSLLVGRDIARRTGRPLVADFRDPWTPDDIWQPAQGRKSASREIRLARSVLAQARGIVNVTDQLTEELRQSAPDIDRETFVTISNGFDRSDFERAVLPSLPRRARTRLVYTGVGKAGYGPHLLYKAIRSLHDASAITPTDLEFVAAGFPPGYAAESGVEPYVSELGPVTHSAALGLMQTADALFLPVISGPLGSASRPGKMYEYAATEKPILAAVDTPSEVSSFLQEIGGGIIVPPNDVEGTARALAALCSKEGLKVPPLRRDRLDVYERRALTKKLSALLDRVCGLRGEFAAA